MTSEKWQKDPDVRDFWPWYGRTWMPWSGFRASRPPFELRELHPHDPLPPSAVWLIRCFMVLLAIAAVWRVVVAVFFSR